MSWLNSDAKLSNTQELRETGLAIKGFVVLISEDESALGPFIKV